MPARRSRKGSKKGGQKAQQKEQKERRAVNSGFAPRATFNELAQCDTQGTSPMQTT